MANKFLARKTKWCGQLEIMTTSKNEHMTDEVMFGGETADLNT